MIDRFDWAGLSHAYGPATDTPGHLEALTSGDEQAQQVAHEHLDSALLHQGFPATATAPAVHVVAWLIGSGAVVGDNRDCLVEWLGMVASSLPH
jgi:hypothetical protein